MTRSPNDPILPGPMNQFSLNYFSPHNSLPCRWHRALSGARRTGNAARPPLAPPSESLSILSGIVLRHAAHHLALSLRFMRRWSLSWGPSRSVGFPSVDGLHRKGGLRNRVYDGGSAPQLAPDRARCHQRVCLGETVGSLGGMGEVRTLRDTGSWRVWRRCRLHASNLC
jgi:hypothetical protein